MEERVKETIKQEAILVLIFLINNGKSSVFKGWWNFKHLNSSFVSCRRPSTIGTNLLNTI